MNSIENVVVANILKKLKNGKSITKREQTIVEEWKAKKDRPENPFDIDTTAIASFFEVTAKTVAAWVKQGMPKESYGVYNLKKCFDWWLENVQETKSDNDPGITALKAENLRIKNDRESMKRDAEKDLLFSKSEIIQEWVKRIVEVRQGLLSLPSKLPTLLEGKVQQEMRPIIREQVVRLLDTYSRAGRFTPSEKRREKK